MRWYTTVLLRAHAVQHVLQMWSDRCSKWGHFRVPSTYHPSDPTSQLTHTPSDDLLLGQNGTSIGVVRSELYARIIHEWRLSVHSMVSGGSYLPLSNCSISAPDVPQIRPRRPQIWGPDPLRPPNRPQIDPSRPPNSDIPLNRGIWGHS